MRRTSVVERAGERRERVAVQRARVRGDTRECSVSPSRRSRRALLRKLPSPASPRLRRRLLCRSSRARQLLCASGHASSDRVCYGLVHTIEDEGCS